MILKYLKYFALFLCLTSCKKCRDCKQSVIQGDIISVYDIPSCFEGGITQGEYCIKDTVSFINLLRTYPNYAANCDTNSIPINIDFSKQTLLGKFVSNGGCSEKYIRNVMIDNESKIVKYIIYSCSKGVCSKKLGSYNFVLVPKFPNNYTVSFQIHKS